MNKEIKEILNGLNVVIKHGGSVEINSKECKKIIDYITNLQEQIEIKSKGFKATVEELCETSEKLEQLQEEIERLQDMLITTDNLRMYYKARYKELKEVKK